MDLFHFQEEAPGSVFWHAKGWTLFQTLIAYMRRRLDASGYNEVNSPDMMEKSFWELSGHWENYHEMMFVTELPDERVFCCKPMNCPGHVQIFKHGLKSYRDLPLKISEFGKVHRYEPSGAMHGLLRVRHFTQDDAHIFITEEQLAEQCLEVNDLLLSIYADFGFKDIVVKLSTRPEKRVGTDEQWDHAEAIMAKVLKEIEKRGQGRIKTAINPGEGAFYGPKFEYVLKDAIGRDWQCGTTQVDFNLPGRLGAFYIDEHSEKKTPVMIHRAIFGSLERFTGVLIENFAGHFPLWLAPLQVVVATIVSDADSYALDVAAKLRAAGLRVDLDLRNEKINYKVREHSLAKVPVMLVVGKREAEEGKVSMRRMGSPDQTVMPLAEAIAALVAEATPTRREACVSHGRQSRLGWRSKSGDDSKCAERRPHELVRDETAAVRRRQGLCTTGATVPTACTKRGCTARLPPSASVTPQSAMVATVIVLGLSMLAPSIAGRVSLGIQQCADCSGRNTIRAAQRPGIRGQGAPPADAGGYPPTRRRG